MSHPNRMKRLHAKRQRKQRQARATAEFKRGIDRKRPVTASDARREAEITCRFVAKTLGKQGPEMARENGLAFMKANIGTPAGRALFFRTYFRDPKTFT